MRNNGNLKYWDSMYSKQNVFGTGCTKLAKVAEKIMRENGVKNVLEVGCGQGRDTIFFSQLGYEVKAFDFCPIAIEFVNKTKESLGLKNFEAFVHDVRNPIDYPSEYFDFVYSNLVFQFFDIDTLRIILKNISRVMKKNSFFLFSTKKEGDKYYKHGTKINDNAYEYKGVIRYFYEQNTLKDLLSDEFKVMQFGEDRHTNLDGSVSAWWKVLLKKG